MEIFIMRRNPRTALTIYEEYGLTSNDHRCQVASSSVSFIGRLGENFLATQQLTPLDEKDCANNLR
jgi:hypothetical protein